MAATSYFSKAELQAALPIYWPAAKNITVTDAEFNLLAPDAFGMVDSAVNLRASIPFTDVPPDLKNIALRICAADVMIAHFAREGGDWADLAITEKKRLNGILGEYMSGKRLIDQEFLQGVDQADEMGPIVSSGATTVFTPDVLAGLSGGRT